MEKIQFDAGVKAYKLGAGVLRFNPADPNVYARFLEGAKKLQQVQTTVEDLPEADPGTAVLEALQGADKQMKEILGWIFGPGNDFEDLLAGVNLLAVAGNGERVVTNLFAALEPVLVAGAERCAGVAAQAAAAKAKARRGRIPTALCASE